MNMSEVKTNDNVDKGDFFLHYSNLMNTNIHKNPEKLFKIEILQVIFNIHNHEEEKSS